MTKAVCGDCGRSFEPDKTPGAKIVAGPLGGAALMVPGAIIGRLLGMFGGSSAERSSVERCPECSAAKRKGRCLSCDWLCVGHCPVCGAMTLL